MYLAIRGRNPGLNSEPHRLLPSESANGVEAL